MTENKVFEPQHGYQLNALKSSADIVIGGGAAGVGKTFCLLLEPIRHINKKGFGAVFFRRTSPMIKAEGGLWDASQKLYTFKRLPACCTRPNHAHRNVIEVTRLQCKWPC